MIQVKVLYTGPNTFFPPTQSRVGNGHSTGENAEFAPLACTLPHDRKRQRPQQAAATRTFLLPVP